MRRIATIAAFLFRVFLAAWLLMTWRGPGRDEMDVLLFRRFE